MNSASFNVPGLKPAVLAAVALGVLSSLGDWVWAAYIPDGAILPGVAHGFLFFIALAFALGFAAGGGRAVNRLLMTLPLAGLALAALFYPVARAVGYIGGLMITWILMWMTLAALQRWARQSSEGLTEVLLRGTLAAIGSGLAFWAISGIWTAPDPTPNYLLRVAQWSFAFFPGLAALFVRRNGDGHHI